MLRNARLLDGRPPLAQSSGRITGGSGDGYDSDSEDAVDEDEDATPGECIVDGKEKGGGGTKRQTRMPGWCKDGRTHGRPFCIDKQEDHHAADLSARNSDKHCFLASHTE